MSRRREKKPAPAPSRHPARALAVAALALAVISVAIGCGARGEADGGTVSVVATTTQVADLARAVAGDAVDVHQLLQPNTDPHEYEPRPADVRAVAEASVILASGDGLDDWIGDVVADSGSDAEVVDLAAGLPVRLPGEDDHAEDDHAEDDHAEDDHAEDEHEDVHAEDGHEDGHEDEHAEDHTEDDHAEDHTEDDHAEDHTEDDHAEDGHHHDSAYDPHWWHDPRNAVAAVREIERTLISVDPAARQSFERNAGVYVKRLRALDAGIAACIDSVPAARRKIVTDHDAFNYFANRYGIEIVGAVIPSQTTQAQPSARDLSELARTIEAEGVEAIFPETSVSSKVADAIAAQTGATAEYTLYGDALGPAGSDAATYLGMEEANADAVVRGLTGGRRGCRPR